MSNVGMICISHMAVMTKAGCSRLLGFAGAIQRTPRVLREGTGILKFLGMKGLSYDREMVLGDLE